MDSQTLINEVQLLKENKADLIEAMQEIGIEVEDSMPLREITAHICEAGGLGCITKIATVEKAEDGSYQHRFFTKEEWDELDASTRQLYPRIGILLIAEGQRLIIAKDYQTAATDSDATTMLWSKGYVDIAGQKNFNADTYGMILDFDTNENQRLIMAHATTLAEGFIIAPRRANEYRGCANDPTYWCLPAMGHMQLIMKYRTQINTALGWIGGAVISTGTHWTSTEYDGYNAWYATVSSGAVAFGNKAGIIYLVRPASAI